MEGCPLGDVVFYGDRSALADESFHALCVSFERRQVQSSAALLVLDIQIDQRLEKYLQGLVVTIIGLEIRTQLSSSKDFHVKHKIHHYRSLLYTVEITQFS